MLFLSIVHHYLLWHYTRAWFELFHVWRNLLWFMVHVFSIPTLLRTWAAPWKRITERRGNTWSFEDLAGYLLIGFLSRLIGFFVRSVVLVIGLVSVSLTILGGFVVYAAWVVAPLLLLFLLGLGITLWWQF